LKIGVGQMD
jgi:hypothetical protein